MTLKVCTYSNCSPALIVNALFNILAANVPKSIGRNSCFGFFASFLIVSLIPFINNPDSSSYLTIFVISSISSFKVINAAVPDP